jgi:hypothetical protein
LRNPQPSLRCLTDTPKVATVLQSAWLAANPGIAAQTGQAIAPVRSQRPVSTHIAAA